MELELKLNKIKTRLADLLLAVDANGVLHGVAFDHDRAGLEGNLRARHGEVKLVEAAETHLARTIAEKLDRFDFLNLLQRNKTWS